MKINKILLLIIKGLIFGCFLTPFLVTKSTFFPFIFGKAIVFQILVEACFVIWVIWRIVNRQERLFSKRGISVKGKAHSGNSANISAQKPDTSSTQKIKSQNRNSVWLFIKSKSFLNYAVTGFFIVLLLTTLTSRDLIRSFWSTQERMTGFFNLIHMGMFYLVLITVFKKKDFVWLLRFSLTLSVIIGIRTLLMFREYRLSGSLGNPGFLALYVLFHIFFGIYLLIDKNESNNLWINWFWKGFCFVCIIINILILYYTRTRGAYLGLGIGLLVFVIVNCGGILRQNKSWSSGKRWAALGFLFIFFGFSLFFARSQIENFERGSKQRLISWGISYRAFKERPILGWGPENYILAFAKCYDPEYTNYSTEWFDKAHNVFFEYLVTTGILGLLAYLTTFIVAGARSPKFIMPLLIAYFIFNLFWIDTTVSLMLFFLSLAITNKDIIKSAFDRSIV